MGVCTSKQNTGPENGQLILSNENSKQMIKKSDSMSSAACHEFAMIVIGFIREMINKFQGIHSYNEYSLPSHIKHLCALYFGSIHRDLIIGNGQTLKLSDLKTKIFAYDSILIKKNATLCINRWNPKRKNGGLLNIVCSGDLIMEEGSTITLTGRGYHGSDHGRNGESYKSICSKTRKPNCGGGGGGQVSICGEYGAQSSRGAGAGYATKGGDGKIVKEKENENENEFIKYYNNEIEHGIGGNCYGDKYLTNLYFGSGGGSGYYFDEADNSLRSNKGGAGGGAIKIKCLGNFIMDKNSKIVCNGNKGKGPMSGAGSGGSIHILCSNKKNLQMNDSAEIAAVGGINTNNSGNGGDGRIRVEFLDKNTEIANVYYHNITPTPYIG